MRNVLYILTIVAVMALAFWAYQQHYLTQQALSETDRLHREIRESHARLAVLRAEWAYLNRPDRLRDLVDINFDQLGLLPLRADQFGHVDEVSYPASEPLTITNAVEVSGTLPQAEVNQP